MNYMMRFFAAILVFGLIFTNISCTKETGPKEVCFYFSKSSVKVGEAVYMFNCSKNFENQLWILPDGSQQNTRHATFTPTSTGDYHVWLRIGDYNLVDTIGKSQSFTVTP